MTSSQQPIERRDTCSGPLLKLRGRRSFQCLLGGSHPYATKITRLAANGRVTRRWCFAPEGALATGNVMLAQKIALETFELNTDIELRLA